MKAEKETKKEAKKPKRTAGIDYCACDEDGMCRYCKVHSAPVDRHGKYKPTWDDI